MCFVCVWFCQLFPSKSSPPSSMLLFLVGWGWGRGLVPAVWNEHDRIWIIEAAQQRGEGAGRGEGACFCVCAWLSVCVCVCGREKEEGFSRRSCYFESIVEEQVVWNSVCVSSHSTVISETCKTWLFSAKHANYECVWKLKETWTSLCHSISVKIQFTLVFEYLSVHTFFYSKITA